MNQLPRAAGDHHVENLACELRKDISELHHLHDLASTTLCQAVLSERREAIEAALDVGVGAWRVGRFRSGRHDAASEERAPGVTKSGTSQASLCIEPPGDAGRFNPNTWPWPDSDTELPADCWRSLHGPVRQIPRYPYDSKVAQLLLEQRKPVVLTHAPLVSPAAGKWTLSFLRANLRDDQCTVYKAPRLCPWP